MKHEVYPLRANNDGDLLPPVVVEVPDVLYLQVVDTDDCEDFPAPSEPGERTFSWERINASDVAYVPDALRAELDAARAAQQWRPVTEPPTEDGDYLVWSSHLGTDIACWYDGQFHYEYMTPTHWHPLPATPGDEEA